MRKDSMRDIPAVAQDELRKRVIAALNNGVKQADAARVFGIPDRTIRRWVAQMRREGVERIEPKRRGRVAGEVSELKRRQAERIKALVIGRMPDQLKLPFYLWTREAVGRLIEREYGIKLSSASIGNWLARWGLSPQKPVRRAYERDDVCIAAWLEAEYPVIKRRAQAQRALIYWADECGMRSDDVRGRTFAPRGKTPEIATTGQRFGCNMISALSNRGALAFKVYSGRFVTPVFIDFLERLLKHCGGRKLMLIVDGHPVHKAKAVQRWLEAHAKRIEMHFLPGYAPELNPDELLNHDVKVALGKNRPRNRGELKAAVRSHLHRRQKQPHIVQRFFNAPHVRYAA
jgi:transposase